MAISFPTSIDTFTNPASTDTTSAVPHATQHANANDAIRALETKVGVDNSAVTTSLDYKLKSTSSISPGHKHVLAEITDYAAATDASTSVKGITRMSEAPVSASIPIAIGSNGTSSGTVASSSNKVIDAADVSSAGASGKVVRLNGTAYPAGDGSALTSVNSSKNRAQFTVGANVTAGQPVYVGPYQSDGGIQVDTSGFCTANSTSVTIGSNSNRALIVFVIPQTSGATVSSASYNGTGMTLITTSGTIAASNSPMYTYYLNAPSTGAHNLDFAPSAGVVQAIYYSVYNVSQSSQPEAQGTTAVPGAGGSATINTIASGATVFSCSATYGTESGTAAYANNKAHAAAASASAWNSTPVFPAATTITKTMATNGTSNVQQTNMISLAPATAPVEGAVSPTTTATQTMQFLNKYAPYIGIAETTVSSGGSVYVTVSGVATGLSGLSVNPKQYYLADSAGTLSTTAGTNTRKAGISLSATTLLITNIW